MQCALPPAALTCSWGAILWSRRAPMRYQSYSPATAERSSTATRRITGDFTRNPDLTFPSRELQRSIAEATGADNTEFIDATRVATGLFGDSIASNLFMLGFAYQRGAVPLSADALERAIELNAVAVEFNQRAFRWGRRAAVDPALVDARATPRGAVPETHRLSETLEQVIDRRVAFLTEYQNAAYAARYASLSGVSAKRRPIARARRL